MPLWKIDRTTWNSGANFRSNCELDETAASVDGLKIKNVMAQTIQKANTRGSEMAPGEV